MLNGSQRTVGDIIFYIFTAIVLCINHVISEKPSDKKKLCKIGKISPSISTFRTESGYDYRFIADVYVCLHVRWNTMSNNRQASVDYKVGDN